MCICLKERINLGDVTESYLACMSKLVIKCLWQLKLYAKKGISRQKKSNLAETLNSSKSLSGLVFPVGILGSFTTGKKIIEEKMKTIVVQCCTDETVSGL